MSLPASAHPYLGEHADPYKGLIGPCRSVDPGLSAVRLLEEIPPAGYEGGYSQLWAHIAEVRTRRAPDPVVRFETPSGHQARVDFAGLRFP